MNDMNDSQNLHLCEPWGTAVQKLNLSMILWLVAASISFGFSVILWFFVNKEYGIFVGLWVPSILSLASCLRSR